ncbi:MAG: hypothetical protein HC804_04875 [Anaerolineae bacterium]|nr:hypothetical protein [Anaerolineae bacterium]
MIKEYQYAPSGRIIWLILTPALFAFWLLSLLLAWSTPHRDTIGLLLVVSLLIWPLLLWGILFLALSTMRVQVWETAVTLHLFRHTHTIPFESITAVKQNRLFLVIQTSNGRHLIERSIEQSTHLLAELHRRAPALRRASVTAIIDPLPRRLSGKPSQFLFGFGLFLMLVLFGMGMAVNVLPDSHSLQRIATLLFSLLSFLIGLLLLYLTLFDFPWRVTFAADQITMRHLLRQQQFAVANLQDAQVKRHMITHKGVTRPSYTLALTFAHGRTLSIQQDAVQQSLLEFLPVLEHHYGIKPVHHRQPQLVPFRRFGTGSLNEFPWYFERTSTVQPATVDELCQWLQACRYISDHEQFNNRDHWLHPVEFESSRQGDCEDHALWAWRKLVELGLPAEFVVGQAKWTPDQPTEAHAWVTYQQDGRTFLLEATAKSNLVQPLESTVSRYHPWYSIDQDFQTYQHNRYLDADQKLSPNAIL